MAKDFQQEELVWAKMKGFPPWPARVDTPADGKIPKTKKPQHYVFFFGTHDFAWILDQNIFPHSEEMLANAKQYKKKSSTMQAAIQEIEEAGKESAGKKSLPKQKAKKESLPPPPSPALADTAPSTSVKKKKLTPKKNINIEKKPAKKRSAPSTSRDLDNEETDADNKAVDSDDDYSLLIADVPPYNGTPPNVAVIQPFISCPKPDFTSMYMRAGGFQPTAGSSRNTDTPVKESEEKSPEPSPRKIGFLGLGVMGFEVVKRLLATGHDVRIWNRSILEAHAELVEAGAKTGRSPADVIQKCDITFSCVSDAEAAKALVFGPQGVLAAFDDGACSGKAYVELSSLDPYVSEEIAEAITGKGGQYLEAPMFGSRQDVRTSQIVVFGAGNRALFHECVPCFAAFTKKNMYVNHAIGAGNRLQKCLCMLEATSYSALAESLSLVNEMKINSAFFMELVAGGPASFKLLLDKGHAMITKDPTVFTPVRHLQKDLHNALMLSEDGGPNVSLASAANGVFSGSVKEEKDSDVSAITNWLGR